MYHCPHHAIAKLIDIGYWPHSPWQLFLEMHLMEGKRENEKLRSDGRRAMAESLH